MHGSAERTRVARLCVETNLFAENTRACMETDASSEVGVGVGVQKRERESERNPWLNIFMCSGYN